MTPHEEQALLLGMVLGAALVVRQQQHDLEALALRLQRVERKLPWALHMLRRLVPDGRRDGHRVYRIAGQ